MSNHVSERYTDGPEIEMTNTTHSSEKSSIPKLNTHSFAGQDVENGTTASRPLLQVSDGYDDDDDTQDDELLTKRDFDADPHDMRTPILRRARSAWPVLVTVGLLSFAAVVVAGVFVLRPRPNPARTPASPDVREYWQGFSKIDHYFAFGDSWTDSHFNVWGAQPSTKNPLGNPVMPGVTSSNALNYVGYLGTQYNESFIKIYDMGWSGATVDGQIDHPFVEWVDLVHQVRDEFMPFYTTNGTTPRRPLGWTSSSAIFSTFFGINDVVVLNKTNPQFDAVFKSYSESLTKLYDIGARNFIIINVPPIDQSPAIATAAPEERLIFSTRLREYNEHLHLMAHDLRSTWDDATIFEFNFHDLFVNIMDDPKLYPQTACYKDTHRSCDEYDFRLPFGTVPTDEQVELCGGLGVEEYLWINKLHVSWPMHDLMGAEMKRLLLDAGMG